MTVARKLLRGDHLASEITPVPGGVGPMTIALLVEQTVRAACRRAGLTDSIQAP